MLDPKTSDLCEKFAEQYAELRKHKGVTVEQAREIIHDVSYFGTMLVHNGMVDGMVSGAAHTTAHTVRPAFEIIKTKPDVSTVSSIFLMCLADRVLAYGDCAIVPDPTSEQLADIAISSARTAAQFGIDPRVAMLSYSTGTSGTGADVDKVRAATELVREREPDLLVDGPDPVRRGGRAVGGRDENARLAGRGPRHGADLPRPQHRQQHLQGGAAKRRRDRDRARAAGTEQAGQRPVPGALVEDIVNTVAITAIQAQESDRDGTSSGTEFGFLDGEIRRGDPDSGTRWPTEWSSGSGRARRGGRSPRSRSGVAGRVRAVRPEPDGPGRGWAPNCARRQGVL